MIVSGMLTDPVTPLPVSSTEKVGVNVPATVGVPLRVPAAVIDIPFGKFEADQEAAPDSPVAASETLLGYGRLTVEPGNAGVVIFGTIESEKSFELVSGVAELSVTWTVKPNDVETFTVPDRTPPGDRLKVPGKGPVVITNV